MHYFIYNPIAGNFGPKKRLALIEFIRANPNNIILETKNKNEECELTQKAIALGAEKIIAVGGDGTINKVASILVKTDIPLGIIPMGSGNGLARHLGISMNPQKALNTATHGKTIQIDACTLGEKLFFCTAGIGFDAAVAEIFDKRKKRGLLNYILAIFIAIKNFKPIDIEIEEGKKETLFLLTIANANQYGNNAYISPFADIQDGNFEIIKIKKSNPFFLLTLGIRLFLKNIHKSRNVDILTANNICIDCPSNQPLHLDGESHITKEEKLKVSILPNALNVIV